jgi:alkylation response protein AidB-like acyl-CoA dehydrogenase
VDFDVAGEIQRRCEPSIGTPIPNVLQHLVSNDDPDEHAITCRHPQGRYLGFRTARPDRESNAIPADIVQGMKELEVFGLSISEEFGELGLTMEEEVRLVFELGRAMS